MPNQAHGVTIICSDGTMWVLDGSTEDSRRWKWVRLPDIPQPEGEK